MAVAQGFGLERRAYGQDAIGVFVVARNGEYSVTDAANSFKDVSTYSDGRNIDGCNAATLASPLDPAASPDLSDRGAWGLAFLVGS
jgi:hypothetical protein